MEKTSVANNHIIGPFAKVWAICVDMFYHRTVLVLVVLFAIGVVSLLWHQYILQSRLVESALLHDAARYSRAITEFRTLYTAKVVEVVRPHGIEVTHDVEGKENAIPLPVTLSIELGNRITEKESGSHVRLYSPYPFPWRSETGGLQDDFARDAWKFFQHNPDTSFFRFEEIAGRSSLRFATADLMRPSCVNCHNTHPESPKTDWKVRDVRGVLEVAIPIDTFISERRAGLRRTFILIGGMTLFGLVTIVVVKSRLRREEKQLRQLGTIVKQTADLVLVTDKEGIIEYINPAFTEFTGYKPEEALGKKPSILKSGEHDQEFYENIWETILAGRPFHGELLNKKKNGQLYYEEKTITPLKDSEGRITHFVSTAKDITGRKQAEKELKKYREHLEELVDDRTAQLELSNKDLEAFSYSVSHDLRAPLRAIAGFSKILLDDYSANLDSEARRLLGVVEDNTHKMSVLIDDLLTFSRLGRKELKKSEINMLDMVNSVYGELKEGVQNRNIKLKTNQLPSAWGDPSLMRQVVSNLLSNAIKFTEPREKANITVSGKKNKEEIIYTFKDDGVGFDMRYADKLFGVFQRLHTIEEFEGTGVGLAIVHRIISKHGGKVWAESKLNDGAKFYVSIPKTNNGAQ